MAVPSGAIESGTCGTCTWYITSAGELVVEPTSGSTGYIEGGILDYYPWTGKTNIVTATIKTGVTIKAKSSYDLFRSSHAYMFNDCTSLVSVTAPAEFWNTNSTSFYRTFYNCKSLKRVNFNGATLSAVTDFHYMFYGCEMLEALDLSSFNTSNAVNFEYMFSGCKSLPSINAASWDVSKVASFRQMFASCKSLVTLDLSGWKTTAATNLSEMFSECAALTSVSMPLLDGTNVKDASGMFFGCASLKSLSLAQTEFPALTNVWDMFCDCTGLAYLDISTLDLSNVSENNRSYMLASTESLTRIKLGGRFVATKTGLVSDNPTQQNARTILNESNGIELSSSAAFDKLTAEERAGVWNRKTAVTRFSVSTYRTNAGKVDEDGQDCRIQINWSTGATTLDRTLTIYKKLSDDPSYPATPAYTEELVGDTGVKVVTFSDVGDYAYDFRVEFYDGTSTFIAFPSIASNIRPMVFDKNGNAELLKVLTAEDYKLKLDSYSDLTSVDGKIYQAITALGWTGVIIDE